MTMIGRALLTGLVAIAAVLAFGGSADASTGPGSIVMPMAATATPFGDGCTSSPDRIGLANFRPACDAHDQCYSAGSTKSRLQCDNELRDGLYAACAQAYPPDVTDPNFRRLGAACNQTATTYYGFVRSDGRSHYVGRGDPA